MHDDEGQKLPSARVLPSRHPHIVSDVFKRQEAIIRNKKGTFRLKVLEKSPRPYLALFPFFSSPNFPNINVSSLSYLLICDLPLFIIYSKPSPTVGQANVQICHSWQCSSISSLCACYHDCCSCLDGAIRSALFSSLVLVLTVLTHVFFSVHFRSAGESF